jgi:hypothetical protein
MDLDLEAQMSVTADFEFPNIELVFPQSHGKSNGTAQAKKKDNRKDFGGLVARAMTSTDLF